MTSELTGQDRVELDLGAVAVVSDRGLRHHRNEDAMAVRRVTCSAEVIAVVCAAHLGLGPGKNHEDKRWPPGSMPV